MPQKKTFSYFLLLFAVSCGFSLMIYKASKAIIVANYHVVTPEGTDMQAGNALGERSKNIPIEVYSPKRGATVTSPVKIEGRAWGLWFFEASFAIKIYDKQGNLLGQGPATATSDWMTESFVPFEAVIPFDAYDAKDGYIEFQQDDPAGYGNFAVFRLPVKFGNVKTESGACTTDNVCIKDSESTVL